MKPIFDPKRWSHFQDRDFLCSLVENYENVLIVGPPKAGKSELIRDMFSNDSTVRINCLGFENFSRLQSELCEKIVKFKDKNKTKEKKEQKEK